MTFFESLKFSLQAMGFLIAVLGGAAAWAAGIHWIIQNFSLWVSLPALAVITVLTTATTGWLLTKDS